MKAAGVHLTDVSNCRVLYIVGQLRAGGLERQLCFLLHGMDRARWQPAVVVWNMREDDTYVRPLRELGVPLLSLTHLSSAFAKTRALRRIVANIAPEVVHSYSFYTNVAAWWATLGTRAVALGAVQSDFIRDKKEAGPWLGRLSARWPRSQIFNSFISLENAARSPGLFVPKRQFLVRNGLDLDAFHSVRSSSNGHTQILGVGSLLPVKRWDRLVAAASALKKSGTPFAVQIAGAGPMRNALEQQARDLGVDDCVRFIGHANNVPKLLADSAFLVHTSDVEGTPNVVMEAMACGRPVVGTDAGDTAALIDNGRTGFVVRRGDDAALVSRIATLASDADLRRRMGEAGRAKAEREFTVDRLVSETFEVYRSLGWNGLEPHEATTQL